MNTNDFLDVREVGEILGMTEAQVYRRIHNGLISAGRGTRNGKACWLVTREAVEQYRAAGGDIARQATDGWLRVPEVARMLGCTSEWVRKMVHRGELPARRNGSQGTLYFHRDDVQKHLTGLGSAS